MSYMENDSQIQFRLPAELKTILMARAKKQGLNISAFLREAIYEFLALHPDDATSSIEESTINDASYAFRVPKVLRAEYLAVCEQNHINPPSPLRKAMHEVIYELRHPSPTPDRADVEKTRRVMKSVMNVLYKDSDGHVRVKRVKKPNYTEAPASNEAKKSFLDMD